MGTGYRHHDSERLIGLGNDAVSSIGMRMFVFHALYMALARAYRYPRAG